MFKKSTTKCRNIPILHRWLFNEMQEKVFRQYMHYKGLLLQCTKVVALLSSVFIARCIYCPVLVTGGNYCIAPQSGRRDILFHCIYKLYRGMTIKPHLTWSDLYTYKVIQEKSNSLFLFSLEQKWYFLWSCSMYSSLKWNEKHSLYMMVCFYL